MKNLFKTGLLVLAICFLAGCQEDLPVPEDLPSKAHDPSDLEPKDAGDN